MMWLFAFFCALGEMLADAVLGCRECKKHPPMCREHWEER